MTSPFAPGSPNWVDLGTTDIARAKEFYGGTLGWTFEQLGPEARGYELIRSHGQVVGGLAAATDPARGTSWAVYFAVADADDAARRVDNFGGKVVVAPMNVLDKGRMAVFQDPAGGYFSVWQPTGLAGVERVRADGAMCWVELMTPDLDTAKAFYAGVLPVQPRDVTLEGTRYTLLEVDSEAVAGACAITPEMGEVAPHWGVYFAVNDCDAAADRALALGATELLRESGPPGRMALMHDPQGGAFCVMTPNPDFVI